MGPYGDYHAQIALWGKWFLFSCVQKWFRRVFVSIVVAFVGDDDNLYAVKYWPILSTKSNNGMLYLYLK